MRFLGNRRKMLKFGEPEWMEHLSFSNVWHLLTTHLPFKLLDMPSPACGRSSSAGCVPRSKVFFRDGKLCGEVSPTHWEHFVTQILFFLPPLEFFPLSEFRKIISDYLPSLPLDVLCITLNNLTLIYSYEFESANFPGRSGRELGSSHIEKWMGKQCSASRCYCEPIQSLLHYKMG